MSYKIKSELSEKQIESDIATYLGLITPPGQNAFRLIDENEQLTGADKQFDRIIPIYLQFKVSEGLKPLGGYWPAPKIFPLQAIRQFRSRNGFADNPTLYFKLRDRTIHATDFQHNVLLKTAEISDGNAYYVAPLTLRLEEYESFTDLGEDRFLLHPFYYHDISVYKDALPTLLSHIPFLRRHISIRPHQRVSSSDHYYSYSRNGGEIAWHSPAVVDEDARLSERLKSIFSAAISYAENGLSTEEMALRIRRSNLFIEFIDDSVYGDNQATRVIQDFGSQLYREYSIRQFLILKQKG
ncbi:MAG: hypothetical protein JST68_13440 [Bacteroidetes bacterium]|nr:hypothetical protein [Bacteroidota bacterium]